MRVTRVQWPVGQGNFASGAIEVDGGALHYVYDCGARSRSHLEPVVAAYARRTPKIDALFVSHLDGDHVDGLDVLLARLQATTVYLPYLSVAERLLQVAAAEFDDARFTASLVQAQFDPAQWFGSRGVERIVFVRGDGSEAGPPDADRPDPEGRSARGEPVLKDAAVPTPSDAQPAGGTALLELNLAQPIRVAVAGRTQNWLLKPYVPIVTDRRAQQFLDRVRRACGLPAGEPLTAAILQDVLKTPAGRSKLRRCYDAVITDGGGRKHNAISMSLYSGPAWRGDRWRLEAGHHDRWLWSMHPDHLAGWIGTGDARLKSEPVRLAWRAFYARQLAMTGTLLLPHHGSRANFHQDLLEPAIRVCLASADERHKGYRHPSAEVVEAIEDAGRQLVHVSKRYPSRWRERISLAD